MELPLIRKQSTVGIIVQLCIIIQHNCALVVCLPSCLYSPAGIFTLDAHVINIFVSFFLQQGSSLNLFIWNDMNEVLIACLNMRYIFYRIQCFKQSYVQLSIIL